MLHTRTALANKMSWADDWTDAPLSPGRRLKPKEDSGIVSDAKPLLNGDIPRKRPRSLQRPRRGVGKEASGSGQESVRGGAEGVGRGKGGSAKEYEDLEDFIVCKPGRDYRTPFWTLRMWVGLLAKNRVAQHCCHHSNKTTSTSS